MMGACDFSAVDYFSLEILIFYKMEEVLHFPVGFKKLIKPDL
jgi:hypothetical protein